MSPYLRNLREKVGHDLLVLASVTVLPRDAAGRVLLVRRADTAKWMTIGGMVEPDEDPADAARREAKEEAGIAVLLGALIGVAGGPQYRMTYPNGDIVSYVTIAYEATIVGGSPRADLDETDDVAWFEPDALAGAPLEEFARTQLRGFGFNA